MAEQLRAELNELDTENVEVDGVMLKPSQCYRFDTNPVHILFNTNCPESLKEKLQAILLKHKDEHESRL